MFTTNYYNYFVHNPLFELVLTRFRTEHKLAQQTMRDSEIETKNKLPELAFDSYSIWKNL